MTKYYAGAALVFSVLMLVVMLVVTAAWYLKGGRVLSVQSASMTPTIHIGDAVLVQKAKLQTIQVGDVVSFRSEPDSSVLISHRLIKREPNSNTLILQGDALSATDTAVRPTQIYGRVVLVAPGLGKWLQWIRTPIGLVITLYVPAVILLVYEIRRLLVASRRTRYRAYT